ncbi:MAG: enoyl-CoA hydratase/isomerase family protein [Oceanococcus sp.]
MNYSELKITRHDHVVRVQMCRPPDNFFDLQLLTQLADCFEALDADAECRVIVLASQGKCFCAGGRLIVEASASNSPLAGEDGNSPLYLAGVRLFRIAKPIVAEVQGPAIGGGLGLSLVADFRVASQHARFAGNFVKLGIHPGFGISHTLPRLIGTQKAGLMLLTGRRVKAEQALHWGLVDELVQADELTQATLALAQEIAAGAPLATQSTRATQRAGLADAVLQMTRHEFAEQTRLAATGDFAEGLKAVAERRPGNFSGQS